MANSPLEVKLTGLTQAELVEAGFDRLNLRQVRKS
jgi:hypothetical protein